VKLLALIIAFGLYHWVEKPSFLQSFSWLEQLYSFLKQKIEDAQITLFLSVVLPVIGLYVVAEKLFDFSTDSLAYLVTHVVVIYYCLGPHTIKGMVDNNATKQALKLSDDATAQEVIVGITNAAMHRWFGVFFWYVVLNIYGAVLYRVVCFLAQSKQVGVLASKTLKVIEFPVTIMMTVSLALASDFDRIWRHCKQYLTTETLWTLNSQFMYKSMDYAVEQCEIETADENKAKIIEMTTLTVLTRMLVVWLVFVALLVLFSIG